MRNRVNIKNFIIQIENDFSVNEWQVNGIQIWPIIRLKLFFYLINKVELERNYKKEIKNKQQEKKSNLKKLKSKIKLLVNTFKFIIWFLKIPQRNFLFLGGDVHRVDFKNCRYNRFFDVLIDKYDIKNSSLYFEYGKDKLKNLYNEENIRFHEIHYNNFNLLNKFFKSKYKCNWSDYDLFIKSLENNPLTEDFAKKNKQHQIQNWLNNSFMPKVNFFNLLLKKIKPKQIHFLCYYSDFNFALLAASYKHKINTVEMQHGPQTDIHLAYGSWSNIPIDGYSVIPKEFWAWDKLSSRIINKWSNNTNFHTVKIIGHPWVDYFIEQENYSCEKTYILYSLQPEPLTLDKLFSDSILNLIKKTKEEWLIRIHPRQLKEKKAITQLLKDNNIYHKSNFEYASQEMLPVLLSKTKIHMTHSSGTTIEASLFNIKTILINQIGLNSFPELINQKKAIYLNYENSKFQKDFFKEINKFSPHKISLVADLTISQNLFQND
jgi:hypothetical protein